MDLPPSEALDNSRSYEISKKSGTDNSINSKSECKPGKVKKDDSSNTIISLGGHASTFGITLKDAQGKDHQHVEWNQKFDADEIVLFLDTNMTMRESEMKCHQSLVPAAAQSGGSNVCNSDPLPGGTSSGGSNVCNNDPLPGGTSVHVYKENLAEVMARNRALMQTAFLHSRTGGHKPFSCGICRKRFNQGSHLQQHIRTHTGERPYACDLCRGSFTRMSDLKRHSRTHTGEKPYKCAACGNQFGDISHLKSHIRIHTREKPFECSECGKPFARQSSLKRHMLTHSKE